MSAVDGTDTEVSTAFQARSTSGAMQPIADTTMLHANADRSDDEESDPSCDPYTTHMRGRVSPSPYTANTERARQFNSYVRGIIEQRLDVLVPISHQPRDLISEIIADASDKFPEFASCVRKRIRTFLKSYRRSRKLKDGPIPMANGIGKIEDMSHSPSPDHTPPNGASDTPVVTIYADNPLADEDDLLPPDSKRVRLSPNSNRPTINSAEIMVAAAAAAASSNSTNNSLSNHEEQAVRQLISGYRESAAFLERAADQLEAMLQSNSSSTC